MDYIYTVSYTHLDVYKRQLMFLPEFLRVTRLAVCHIDLTGLGIIYDVSTQNSDLCHALFSRFDLRRKIIVTVSYTHLDVYKRQGYHHTDTNSYCHSA